MKAGETSVQQKDLAEPLSLEISSISQHTACARLGSHLEKVIPSLPGQWIGFITLPSVEPVGGDGLEMLAYTTGTSPALRWLYRPDLSKVNSNPGSWLHVTLY